MPPRVVCRTRPSGVVRYFLMWARSSFTSSGGMGMVLVSLSARCLRPRSWREVPWSVQAVPAREAEAARTIRPQPFVQVQVGLAEHHRLRRAQRGVVQAAVERLQVCAPVRQSADCGQELPGLGGADHHPPVTLWATAGRSTGCGRWGWRRGGRVRRRSRGRCRTPTACAAGSTQAGLPVRVLAHAPSASRTVAGSSSALKRQGGAGGPAEGEGDLARRVGVAGGGVERPGEQCPAQHPWPRARPSPWR